MFFEGGRVRLVVGFDHVEVARYAQGGAVDLTLRTAAEAGHRMDELCEVYADAYGAVPGEANSAPNYPGYQLFVLPLPATRR